MLLKLVSVTKIFSAKSTLFWDLIHYFEGKVSVRNESLLDNNFVKPCIQGGKGERNTFSLKKRKVVCVREKIY